MKNIIATVFTLFVFVNIYSQDEVIKEYPIKGDSQFGVSIGSYSSIVTDDGISAADGTARTYNFGFSANYEHFLSRNWGLKTGLTFDPKGSASINGVTDLKLQYITVPLLASWHFGKKRRWYLHFGVYVGYLLSADVEGVNVKSLLNDIESGFDVGIGIKIPVAGLNFYVESDGQTGFANPGKDNEDSKRRLSRNSISIGVLF